MYFKNEIMTSKRNQTTMAFSIISTALMIAFTVLLTVINGELFTSVSDLAKITLTHKSIASILDDHIKLEEERLRRLRSLKQTYLNDLSNIKSETTNHQIETSHHTINPTQSVNGTIAHPISAFVSVKRLTKGIDQIYHLLVDEANDNSQSTKAKIDIFEKSNSLPNEDDYYGVSDAIFRLQNCYKLDIHHLAQGRLIGKYKGLMGLNTYRKYTNEIGAQLDYEDCFSLGRIAYDKEEYNSAVEWFEEALDLYRKSFKNESQEHATSSFDRYLGSIEESELTEKDILEYLAFSAFKQGQIKYAYEVTLQWSLIEPNDVKAKDNLEYYLSVLDRKDTDNGSIPSDTSPLGDSGRSSTPKDKILARTHTGSASYLDLSSEDDITEALCRGENIYPKSLLIQKLKCYLIPAQMNLKNVIMLNYKSEQLYTSPNVMRIHNFLTNEESHYLRSISKFKLERSTVQTSKGQQPSDFRIAKTAWLEKKDRVVRRIERRISDILNLRLEESENLQVVNYGLGGYYAAHFDFARSDYSAQRVDLRMSGLAKNDRLVTFLIYISDVEAGGATVFPQLGVTVDPIKNSAVIWYNIHKNGLVDRRTNHAGCPVLYGSKWIATKWLREDANTFTRPCSLSPSD